VFSSVVGHRRLLALLSRALARDTLPPALLFAGPAGVGKRRVAMAMARAAASKQSIQIVDVQAGIKGRDRATASVLQI